MSQSVAQLLATSERMLKRKKTSAKKKAKKKASKKSKPRKAKAKPAGVDLERLALQVALFGRPVRKTSKRKKPKAKAKAKAKPRPKKKKAKAKAKKKPKSSSSSGRVKPNSRGTKAEREAWGRMMKRKRKAASK